MNSIARWRFAVSAAMLPLFACPMVGLSINASGSPPSPGLIRTAYHRQAAIQSPFLEQFDKISEEVKRGFYDRKLHGVNWEKVTASYRQRLPGVKDKAEFARLVNALLGELHASHMGYFTDDEAEYYMFQSVLSQNIRGNEVDHIGVSGAIEGKEYVVRAVLDGGPAERAGIMPHDRLQLADGKPFSTVGSFREKTGKLVNVQLQRPGEDKPRTVTVIPTHGNVLKAYLTATERSARVIEVGDRRIGYVHLWTMANEAFKELLNQLVTTKLHETDGLILDLRDGYGGSPFGYIDVFTRPDVSWESFQQDEVVHMTHTGYAKPMVVITNDGTRSAKEFFTYEFKNSHRATIVGTRTAGAFIGAIGRKIAPDGLLELAGLGLRVNGKPLENNGVEPDILVEPKDSYTERDTQMAQAKITIIALIPKDAPKAKGPTTIRVTRLNP